MLMYGREPSSGICTSPMGHEVNEFPAVLQSKLAKLQDLVETHNAEAASRQKSHYDKTSSERHFIAGDIVWLSIPTAGKLDPRWDGRWHINSVKSPLTVEITDGEKTKTVHVNRVRHRRVPNDTSGNHPSDRRTHQTHQSWEAPTVDHLEIVWSSSQAGAHAISFRWVSISVRIPSWHGLDVYGVLWLIKQFSGIVPLGHYALHVMWMCGCVRGDECRRADNTSGDNWRHDLCTWHMHDQLEHSRTLIT